MIMKSSLRIGLAVALCAGLLAACEIPQSVTIKSSPGVHVPLGSPFGNENTLIDDFLNIDQLKSQMGDGFAGEIYNYNYSAIQVDVTNPAITVDGTVTGVNPVQTYVVRYPVADMDNFISFDDLDIPSVTIPAPGSAEVGGLPAGAALPVASQESDPVYLPLDSMKEWVKEITFNDDTPGAVKYTKVILKGAAGFADSLQLQIINLGIGPTGFVSGLQGTGENEGDLLFTATQATLPSFDLTNPANKIEVKSKLSKVPSESRDIPVEVKLEWKEADIYPPDGLFTDTIEGLSVSDLTEFLGGAAFKYIPAYMYINGAPAGTTMTLNAKYAGLTDHFLVGNATTGASITSAPFDPSTVGATVSELEYIGMIPAPSVSSFDFAGPFNATDTVIEYTIALPGVVTIQNDGVAQKIKADLVIVLPLDFTVPRGNATGPNANVVTIDGTDYIKLNLDAIPDSTEDLFGRTSDADGMVLDGLTMRYASVTLSQIQNSVTTGLVLGLQSIDQIIPLDDWASPPPITFTDLTYPFNPGFVVLVEPPASGQAGSLTIKPVTDDPRFDFFLSVDAQADLNLDITL
jgi:hypothetical protein